MWETWFQMVFGDGTIALKRTSGFSAFGKNGWHFENAGHAIKIKTESNGVVCSQIKNSNKNIKIILILKIVPDVVHCGCIVLHKSVSSETDSAIVQVNCGEGPFWGCGCFSPSPTQVVSRSCYGPQGPSAELSYHIHPWLGHNPACTRLGPVQRGCFCKSDTMTTALWGFTQRKHSRLYFTVCEWNEALHYCVALVYIMNEWE